MRLATAAYFVLLIAVVSAKCAGLDFAFYNTHYAPSQNAASDCVRGIHEASRLPSARASLHGDEARALTRLVSSRAPASDMQK